LIHRPRESPRSHPQELIGIPPADLIKDVFAAYLKEGLDAVEILRRSVEVTKEFEYDATLPNVRERIKPRFVSTKLVPVKNRILSEVLNPQPRCSEVLKELLAWIGD